MSKIIKIYKAEALFLQSSALPLKAKEAIKERYTVRFYNEKVCQSCEHLSDRHSEEFCQPCGAYTDEIHLSGEYEIGKNKYVKAPLGDEAALRAWLNGKGFSIKLYNKQPSVEKKYPLKFTGKLYEYQVDAPPALVAAKRGVLEAPPRTGKTVLFTATACLLQHKTLILASQREWLDGFYDTFVGSERMPALTNIPKSRIGFPKTVKEFKHNVVNLCTYQTFLSERGQQFLQAIRNDSPVVLIDEVHKVAATEFLKIVGNLNARYMFGCSGTPSRKDGRYKLVDLVLGKVAHRAKREVMQCTWIPIRTEFKDARATGLWANLVKRLEKDPKRLKLIAEYAIKDAKDGHIILIPFSQIAPIKALVELINKTAGEQLAYAFTGNLAKHTRRNLVTDAQMGRIPILVGTLQLLSVGLNVPPASALYEVALSSNIENSRQRISRILTPHDGKKPPIVRAFMDDYKVRRSCLRVEWYGDGRLPGIKKHFNPAINPKDELIWNAYISGKDSGPMTEGRQLLGW